MNKKTGEWIHAIKRCRLSSIPQVERKKKERNITTHTHTQSSANKIRQNKIIPLKVERRKKFLNFFWARIERIDHDTQKRNKLSNSGDFFLSYSFFPSYPYPARKKNSSSLVFAIIICKLNLPRIWQARAFLSFIIIITSLRASSSSSFKKTRAYLSSPSSSSLYTKAAEAPLVLFWFGSHTHIDRHRRTHNFCRCWWLWNDVTSFSGSSSSRWSSQDPGRAESLRAILFGTVWFCMCVCVCGA